MNSEFSASNNEKPVKNGNCDNTDVKYPVVCEEGIPPDTNRNIENAEDKKGCNLCDWRRTGVYVACFCSLVFFQSLIVSGYHSGITTSLEKRFRLSSRNLGILSSSYDIAAIVGTLIVSYLGDNINRALFLAFGALLMSIGCIIYAVPYYIGGIYYYEIDSNIKESIYCSIGDSCTIETDVADVSLNTDTTSMIIVCIGFAVMALGASPIYNLGFTYLYDNCKISQYPILSGIAYAMGAFGPACGFIVSSFILNIYVNPGHVPDGASVNDDKWIGAWWLGILIFGGGILITGLIFFTFPRKLPNIDRSTRDDDDQTMAGLGKHILEFPHILWRLLKNPTWLFASLGYVSFQNIATGFIRFMGKYFETTYGLPVASANLTTGYVLIPPTIIGIILGGVIMAKLKLPVKGITRYLFLLNVVPTCFIGYLIFITCDTPKLAGVNVTYNGSTSGNYEYCVDCNMNCPCTKTYYSPVCDPGNDVTFYNPCYAGCEDPPVDAKGQFSNCSCTGDPEKNILKSGRCERNCGSYSTLLIVLIIIILFASLGHNPLHLITLRSVESSHRSFALGMQAFLTQLLAFIPSPIIYGTIFDAACILKSPNSSDNLCYEYDVGKLTTYMFGMSFGFQMLATIFFGLCWFASSFSSKLSSNYDLEKSSKDFSNENSVSYFRNANNISTISGNYNTSP